MYEYYFQALPTCRHASGMHCFAKYSDQVLFERLVQHYLFHSEPHVNLVFKFCCIYIFFLKTSIQSFCCCCWIWFSSNISCLQFEYLRIFRFRTRQCGGIFINPASAIPLGIIDSMVRTKELLSISFCDICTCNKHSLGLAVDVIITFYSQMIRLICIWMNCTGWGFANVK